MLKTGDLRDHIYLHQPSGDTRDASGAVIPTMSRIGPIWAAADFKQTGSDERHLADQTTAITAVNFTIRTPTDFTVTTHDHLEYEGRMYAIRSVLEADPKRCFVLLETEQLGDNYTP